MQKNTSVLKTGETGCPAQLKAPLLSNLIGSNILILIIKKKNHRPSLAFLT
jgi:hypothetical protein